MDVHSSEEIKLACDGVGGEPWLPFAHLHELSQYVVSLGTMSRKLVTCVPLKYVCTSFNEIPNYVKVSAVRC